MTREHTCEIVVFRWKDYIKKNSSLSLSDKFFNDENVMVLDAQERMLFLQLLDFCRLINSDRIMGSINVLCGAFGMSPNMFEPLLFQLELKGVLRTYDDRYSH